MFRLILTLKYIYFHYEAVAPDSMQLYMNL